MVTWLGDRESSCFKRILGHPLNHIILSSNPYPWHLRHYALFRALQFTGAAKMVHRGPMNPKLDEMDRIRIILLRKHEGGSKAGL